MDIGDIREEILVNLANLNVLSALETQQINVTPVPKPTTPTIIFSLIRPTVSLSVPMVSMKLTLTIPVNYVTSIAPLVMEPAFTASLVLT